MGLRGPSRTPTPILEASGSSLAEQRKRTEPRPPPGIAQPPPGLDAGQRAIFRAIARQLQQMRVLTVVDSRALGRYVELLTAWRTAQKEIRTTGRYVTQVSREGHARTVVSPAVIDSGVIAGQLLRLEQQFGLTPAARASLAVNPEKTPGTTDDPQDGPSYW